jgi:4-hydroxy-tetrahydrodipicolinate synthase
MDINQHLKGSMVAIITPMFEDGTVDYNALKSLVEFHIESGTSAIVSVGTTGESATIPPKEHLSVIKNTIDYVAGRIPVIAGTGANSTSEAIELTKEAKIIGADACLLVTPYYNKPTQEGLYLHHKAIAESVEISQILYNVPGRTAVNMSVETTVRLSAIDNIIGIKDATGDLEVAKSLVDMCPDNFMLYSGDDATCVEFILLGGHGGISVTANVVPKEVSEAYSAAILKNTELARQIDNRISCLHKDLFIESNPIPVKWALHRMGRCKSGIRLPLTQLSDKAKKVVEKDLSKLGVI